MNDLKLQEKSGKLRISQHCPKIVDFMIFCWGGGGLCSQEGISTQHMQHANVFSVVLSLACMVGLLMLQHRSPHIDGVFLIHDARVSLCVFAAKSHGTPVANHNTSRYEIAWSPLFPMYGTIKKKDNSMLLT